MINKRVLILTTYPISVPLHGGQLRTEAIVNQYKRIFKQVKTVAIFHKKFALDYTAEDLPISDSKLIKKAESQPFASDIICGEAIYQDKKVNSALTKIIQEFNPDIIQLEQPYPYFGLEPLLKDLNLNPLLIYSSQNIEWKMKKNIFNDLKIPISNKKELIQKVQTLEAKLTNRAKLVIAVSQDDKQELLKMGAQNCIVAANGINKITPTDDALKHWQKFMDDNQLQQLVTFVGSAHPPNLLGYEKMVGYNLEFLPVGTGMALAGGISEYIQQTLSVKNNKEFWNRAFPLGKLSHDNLAGLIQTSDVLLLPIISGGGSNLKTAEAILANRKVVATNYAFRSFEKFKELSNIETTDSPGNFKNLIIDSLKQPFKLRTPGEQKLADRVQWKYCLAPLKTAVETVALGKKPSLIYKSKDSIGRIYKKAAKAPAYFKGKL